MSKNLHPSWLIKKIKSSGSLTPVKAVLREFGLSSVCEEALCPNIWECFEAGQPAFMIMGENCTRSCGFCSVKGALPAKLDLDEPHKVAQAARRLKMDYAVVTSVARDDLADGGASHFAKTVSAVKSLLPPVRVEALVPDFKGSRDAVACVAASKPEVFAHNVETVPGLYAKIRPQADYGRSLTVLRAAAECGSITKSGLMVGLGESRDEVIGAMRDLAGAGVKILTIGQYLRPIRSKYEIAQYIPPGVFVEYERAAESLGFCAVASGPFARSSYRARELYLKALVNISDARRQR